MLAVANRVAEREGRRVVLRGALPGVRRLLHLVPHALDDPARAVDAAPRRLGAASDARGVTHHAG